MENNSACQNRHVVDGFVFLLSLLMLAGTGVTSLKSRDIGRRVPGAFCVSDGWQSQKAITVGIVTTGSAKPSITRSLGDIIYSSSQNKVLIDDDVMQGENRVTRIYNYPEKILYTIRGSENQTCTKTVLPGPFDPLCVPDNATMTAIKSFYGVNSTFDNRKFFSEWEGKVKDVAFRVSFTMVEFGPLFMQQWGRDDEGSFFKTWEFFNSTIWGSIPAQIFNPPAVCDHVMLNDVGLSDVTRTNSQPRSPLGIL